METDTIAAISTALGNAGISIVRISGKQALTIADRIYQSKSGKKILSEQLTHTIHYGYIIDENKVIDEVVVLIMKAPNSYTKEDIIEIDCHGGTLVTKQILETTIKYGARLAEPGEFTKRAFLNGRIDLSQAEAVIDLIQAKNDFAVQSSINQLKGNIGKKIKKIRKNIIHDIAFIEASLDDPEHINTDGFSIELREHLKKNQEELESLLKSFENNRILKEGIKTVIVGKPNAGKSSLLNTLVGDERAIVTEIEGTTRDSLEETISFEGITLQIIDTAGIRNTEDIIEKIGVERAKQYIKEADLILYLVDASRTLDENDEKIIEMIQEKKALVLLNKVDLNIIVTIAQIAKKTNKKVIPISAKQKIGIDKFLDSIKDMFYNREISFNDEVYITNVRHKTAILKALESLKRVEESLDMQMSEDFYSIDLIDSCKALGSIIGEEVQEELIHTIFSEFCMGK